MKGLFTQEGQAILLLCGVFGRGSDDGIKPLSLSEFNNFCGWLDDLNMDIVDVFRPDIHKHLQESTIGLDAQRIEGLLARGATVALTVEGWMNKGVWLSFRTDDDYPIRLLENRPEQAPPVIYGVGPRSLLNSGGLAVVGSRNVDENGASFARKICAQAAREGMTIVSGGAKGVDQIAMGSALRAGGNAVGVLANGLLRASLASGARGFLSDGQLTLISPYHPESGWNVAHAMARNKHVYSLSDYGLVISSDYNHGGTWSGAVQHLRSMRTVSLFVRSGSGVPEGNVELIKMGGVPCSDGPWDPSVSEALEAAAVAAREGTEEYGQQNLFDSC